MDHIAQELRSFVVENFLFGNGEKLNNSDSFLDNGIVDSTGILELVSFLDQKFGIRVEDEELVPENLDSIDRLVEYLGRKMQTQVAHAD
jgi:acyl carrier protein